MENETVVVGEVEAGQAAKARKQISTLIKMVNSSTFDIADGLHEIKTKKFYAPEYESFGDYAKTLDLKVTKAYYLVRMVENMAAAGVPRATYEPVGIAKLRVICKLDILDKEGQVISYNGMLATDLVKSLVTVASEKSLEDMNLAVSAIQGLTGEDALVWVNIKLKKAARDIVQTALNLAKKNIGSVGQDVDGNFKDASDGAALEVIAVDFIQDPNNHYDTNLLKQDEIKA
jgi:hypothetical protein